MVVATRLFTICSFLLCLSACKYSVSEHQPDKAWESYTVTSPMAGAGGTTPVLDMEGNKIKEYPCTGFPAKVLNDGSIICNNLKFGRLVVPELRHVSHEGEILWSFNSWSNGSAKQHHDYQVDGNPVGYYVPGMEMVGPGNGGNILVLGNISIPRSEQDVYWGNLKDAALYEVNPEGEVIWQWIASEHIDQMGFTESALRFIYRSTSRDWLHMNTASYLGPNKWYEEYGDERFHPENIMVGSAKANFVAIIEKTTGDIVWRMGPDYSEGNPGSEFDGINFSHNAHIIPKGLPGEGNILIFDNGSFSGKGEFFNWGRPYSRVMEINPMNFSVVWEYRERLLSPIVSNVQRLPNGNTFICEGLTGTLLEVTPEKEVVWEAHGPPMYRAYRIPMDWVTPDA